MMERLGLIQRPSLLDHLAFGFAQFRRARPLDRSARSRRNCMSTSHLSGVSAPLDIEFPSAVALPDLVEKSGPGVAQVSKPNPYAPWRRQAGAKEEEKCDDHLSRLLRSLRAQSTNTRGPFEGASVGGHRCVPLVVLHCAHEGAWQGAGRGHYRKGK